MAVNLKVEDTQGNLFLASYNRCIELGIEKISQVFNFNAEENEDYLILVGILKNKMGDEGVVQIKNIVKKLQENDPLTKQEQFRLGIAYNVYRNVRPIEEKKIHVLEKEADFDGKLGHRHSAFPQINNPKENSFAKKTTPRPKRSSHLQEITNESGPA